ncbi:hypothetical protein [Mycobacterium sp. MMS18-G62]
MTVPPSPDPWDEPEPDDADTGPLQISASAPAVDDSWESEHGSWADKFDAPLIVNPRPVHRERKPVIVLGSIALLGVLVVGSAIFWLMRPTSESSTSSGATTTSAASTPPNPEADRLLRMVPAGYSSTACKAVATPKSALAQVSCEANSDAGGPLSATYTLGSDKAALDTAFNDIVAASTRVDCPGNIQSPGPWRRNATPDKVSGVLFCGVQSGRPTVAWTDEARLVVSAVQSGPQGPTFDQLYAWWSSHS